MPETHPPIPLQDLDRIHAPLRPRLLERIEAVLASNRFILGQEVEAFERELAEACGVDHAVAVSSGTDALLVTLMALDVGPGDEVVTTPFTFVSTAEVVHRVGARIVFADVDPATCNLDPASAVRALSPRTRAVIPVHLFGQCAHMDVLAEACAQRGAVLVEDAAQAIGARDATGRRVGQVGEAACLSFFPAKNLGAFGDAGAVLTRDATLAGRVRQLRVHGAVARYRYAHVGGNFRMDALQAAILRVKLEHLDEWTAARRRAAAYYRALLDAAGLVPRWVQPLADESRGGHVYNQFVVRAAGRDALRSALGARGIHTAVYYPEPLHLQPCFAYLGHRPGDLPHAERAAREVVALPLFPGIERAEQERVVEAMAAFYETFDDAEGLA